MHKLLVDTPGGEQKILIVGQGGGYFDASRIVWDDRVDGPLDELAPGFQLGGMIREGGGLVYSGARNAEHAAATAPAVPQEVAMAQARKALVAAGVDLALIDSYIDSIGDATEKALAKIDWEFAAIVRRRNPLVLAIAEGIGLSDEQVDALFISAAGFIS